MWMLGYRAGPDLRTCPQPKNELEALCSWMLLNFPNPALSWFVALLVCLILDFLNGARPFVPWLTILHVLACTNSSQELGTQAVYQPNASPATLFFWYPGNSWALTPRSWRSGWELSFHSLVIFYKDHEVPWGCALHMELPLTTYTLLLERWWSSECWDLAPSVLKHKKASEISTSCPLTSSGNMWLIVSS